MTTTMPTTSSKAIRQAADIGEELPRVPEIHSLHTGGVRFRRGQFVMIAAVPNAGKSSFASWLAAKMQVPTLYFSADQDPWTAMSRFIAAQTGTPAWKVVQDGFDQYSHVLPPEGVNWVWDPSPTIETIDLEVDAYVEMWDAWPHLIVVDNLLNVEGSGELQDDQYILQWLHELARRTNACVLVLAHASEVTTKDTAWPPRRKDIINKLSKLQPMILTVANDEEEGVFRVALVKSREVKSDPNAKHPWTLSVDMASCTFRERSSGW